MENPSPTSMSGRDAPFLWIFRINILDLYGGNSSTKLHINNMFPLLFPLSGYDSELEYESDSENFNSTISDFLA